MLSLRTLEVNDVVYFVDVYSSNRKLTKVFVKKKGRLYITFSDNTRYSIADNYPQEGATWRDFYRTPKEYAYHIEAIRLACSLARYFTGRTRLTLDQLQRIQHIILEP